MLNLKKIRSESARIRQYLFFPLLTSTGWQINLSVTTWLLSVSVLDKTKYSHNKMYPWWRSQLYCCVKQDILFTSNRDCFQLTVWLFWSYHNKVLNGLEQQILLRVLELGRLKPRYQQSHSPSENCRGELLPILFLTWWFDGTVWYLHANVSL